MEVPGFDLYAFPSRPGMLYAIRNFELKVGGEPLELIVELLIKKGCHRTVIKQGKAKKPSFLIQNSAEGLLKPVGAGLSKEIRKLLFSCPAGDILEGCADAIRELSAAFGSLPLPSTDVAARIPVVLAEYVEFESNSGSRRDVKRAVFELKPSGYGYLVATPHGLEEMAETLERRLRALSP